ncbi:MAG TPA: FGGY family carbohydrate kinase [Thermoleophilaceae bacterium]|nr:FGGY family carbohydrate kinase [Thermoleophilaceae bacterium]
MAAASEEEAVWVGLDVGTQSVRALAVSASGGLVGSGSRPLASRRDGDRHEQDPREWWDALAAASHTALSGIAAERIRGVATDGTSGTVLLLDSAGAPVTPALMYDDSRATDQARRVNDEGQTVWSSLGYRMQPGWALPKLLWMLEEWPEVGPGARLAHQPDYITRRLCGREVPADTSHALKTGYDLIRERWPDEVLEKLGVPDALMPSVVRSGSALGEVCAEAARQTGIPAGTPVIAGMTDGCAAQLAAGALSEGHWNSVLGTTLVLKGFSSDLIRDPNGVLYSHRAPDEGWLPGGASNTGAGALSANFPDRDLDELGREAADREQTGVLAYPLLGCGERFPFAAPDAEGFLLGDPANEAEHFAALLHGLAYIERLCFDYLDLLGAPVEGELSLTGGASRNRYWCQLRADVLDRPVRLPENAESALGMAVLAASAGRSTAESAAEMVRVREVIEPRRDRVERFQEPYARLLGELEERGWLDPRAARHARARTGA